MPHVTLKWTQDGLALPVMVGITGQATAVLVAAGKPVPRPVLLNGVIDSGTNITAVAAPVLASFGLIPSSSHFTHGIGGSLSVQLFDVSLSILPVGALQAPLLVLPELEIMQ
jgi:hypothetical protein